MSVLAAWFRVAMVDLRGDLRRFGVLLACLALGVATIAIVGSVGAALQSALNRDARALLGADLDASLSYRLANTTERELFATLGTVAEVVQVMGNGVIEENSVFLTLKGVSSTYPLVGTIDIADPQTPGAGLQDLIGFKDGAWGIVADDLLQDRLGVKIGDRFTVDNQTFELRGLIAGVPDQMGSGFAIGIPTIISMDALNATTILAEGVLAQYHYKIALDVPFEEAKATIKEAFPTAGWKVSSPDDATADLSRFFDVFTRFLTIVGLSALIVGGVGVSNAIAAYVTERQRSIATLKALGATSGRILFHFMAQVLLLTLVGIVLGMILGGIITVVALPIVGNLLGIALQPIIDIPSLLVASGFGILVGIAFAFLPLKRAEFLRPALLFRAAGAAVEGGISWREMIKPNFWLPLLVAAALIYGLAYISTRRPELVFWYAIGIVASFLVLRFAGWALQRILRLLPTSNHTALRNALKSIYRPGAPAPTVILSLGLGLALLLLIALIDNNLRHQLDSESIPDAPSFVFMDLFEDEVAGLTDFATADTRVENFEATPLLRGAIESVNGVAASELPPIPEEFQDAYEGEIPLTAASALPPRSTILEGAWWPADYAGEPQVSVFDRVATPLGLKLGDKVVFRIFGEPITAQIANIRTFTWRNGGVNFAFVLTPGVLDEFPVSYLGLMKAMPGEERALQQTLVQQFPDSVFLPVTEALDVFARVLNSVTNAVAVIGGLAVISGLLVLAGAMAAGRRQREADAVIMKVLGASRGDIIRAYLIEYGVLGGLAALLAAALGLFGTWAFVTQVLEIDFHVNWLVIVGVIVAAVVLTVAVGVATTWSALSVKPARFLREE